jgi:hypothetical protein
VRLFPSSSLLLLHNQGVQFRAEDHGLPYWQLRESWGDEHPPLEVSGIAVVRVEKVCVASTCSQHYVAYFITLYVGRQHFAATKNPRAISRLNDGGEFPQQTLISLDAMNTPTIIGSRGIFGNVGNMRFLFREDTTMPFVRAASTVLLVFSVAEVHAALIQRVPTTGISYGTPSQIVGLPITSTSFESAAEFTTTSAGWVDQLTWYGFYSGNQPTLSKGVSFLLRFMQNNRGVPGSIIEEISVSPTPNNLTKVTGYQQYSVSLAPDAVDLSAAGNHWLSIMETDSRTAQQWNWQYSTGYGTLGQRKGDTSAWGAYSSYPQHQLAYSLDIVDTVIPEPSSFIAWTGLGALGLIGATWRRRKPA